jgi:hypothetical protein
MFSVALRYGVVLLAVVTIGLVAGSFRELLLRTGRTFATDGSRIT